MSPSPAPAPDSRENVILDLQHVEEIRNMPGLKEASLLSEFAALFMREEPARIAELSRLAKDREYGELKRLAHATAGSCAMLGALEMQHASLRVQGAAQVASASELTACLAALDAAWVRLQATLKEQRIIL